MTRKNIVAGNWKMNTSLSSAAALIKGIKDGERDEDVTVMVAPPTLYAQKVNEWTIGSFIQVAAQNCHPVESGAFTGEVSISQIADAGLDVVIVGHSERRDIFGETNSFIKEKVDAVLDAGLTCIFCCGESLEIRKNGTQNDFVARQIKESLFHLKDIHFAQIVIAYEPIWAIGTGETASPEQAEEMHAFIRNNLSDKYGKTVAGSVSILYGGSVKPANAKEIFSQPNVDGGLVGGASLDADSFISIINSF